MTNYLDKEHWIRLPRGTMAAIIKRIEEQLSFLPPDVCSICRGTGEVFVTWDQNDDPEVGPCNECQGKGKKQ